MRQVLPYDVEVIRQFEGCNQLSEVGDAKLLDMAIRSCKEAPSHESVRHDDLNFVVGNAQHFFDCHSWKVEMFY